MNLIVVLLAFLQTQTPTFEIELWPGEGRPVLEASSNELVLRESPASGSRITQKVTVKVGQELIFDETRYQTVQPGRISVVVPSRVTGRMLGTVARLTRDDYYSGNFESGSVETKPGMNIEYLQYRAEGTCFVRIAGKVIEADPCPTSSKRMFKVESEPKTQLWMHILVDNSRGWLLVTDSSAKIVRREF